MSSERVRGALVGVAIVVAANAAFADDFRLKTLGGFELGALWSSYKYEEPGIMNEKGHKLGLSGAYTTLLEDNAFLIASLRYATGKNTYTGSGTLDRAPDTMWEARFLSGKDYVNGDYALAPYLGLGYRTLHNDLRGTTTTGAVGYRRKSEYLYLPIGITHRIAVAPSGIQRIATNLEYDYFIRGRQTSTLSDTGLPLPEVVDYQKGGHGLKASVAYEMEHASFGLYADYWKATTSPATYFVVGQSLFFVWEPENNTHEYGVFAKYRF